MSQSSCLINFFAEQLSSVDLEIIDGATKQVVLPSEFKRSIGSLTSREHFKASELKTFLLYFGPIVFQTYPESSVAHQSNLQSLNYLVFSLRSMYESDADAEFCGYLLEAFCYNMSLRYPLKKFESINFHLLRHLAWQCTFFGSLWPTSATMFESANNHLIRTLTGTFNTCSLIVKRYIRNRHFDALEVKDDNITGFLETLRGKQSSLNEDYSMKQNEVYENFQSKFPGAWLQISADIEANLIWTANYTQDLNQTVLFLFLRRTKLW